MKKIIISLIVFCATIAFASQLINLKTSELEAANFLSKCASKIPTNILTIVSGFKGTFPEGIMYSFKIQKDDNSLKTLQVRWTRSTRAYSCEEYSN